MLEKIKEMMKNPTVRWTNIFVRDLLLVIVVMFMHFRTGFRSYSLFFISGMLTVWITWQLSDFINYHRRLKNAPLR